PKLNVQAFSFSFLTSFVLATLLECPVPDSGRDVVVDSSISITVDLNSTSSSSSSSAPVGKGPADRESNDIGAVDEALPDLADPEKGGLFAAAAAACSLISSAFNANAL
ncbi:hypothetical protein BX616_007305, partial [Lobosporangium transversale]